MEAQILSYVEGSRSTESRDQESKGSRSCDLYNPQFTYSSRARLSLSDGKPAGLVIETWG
jgi:hypothetical protein